MNTLKVGDTINKGKEEVFSKYMDGYFYNISDIEYALKSDKLELPAEIIDVDRIDAWLMNQSA